MSPWALFGAAPFLLLGVLHLAQALRDVRLPKYWLPTDTQLVTAMKATGVVATANGPGGRDLWRTWQGANITHSLGLVTLAALVVTQTLTDGITRPLTAVAAIAGAAYSVVAFSFWFLPAGVLAALGTTGFLLATILGQ
ncbi:LIC_13387 family protein [Kribbella sp. CA-294648]|uniref:LIC_13387 family protein n=1 Tax=Kribbella sp. CA-294648 TaxID=3239948 RepID=UPI003D8D3935